jgi:uncharacterized protein (TIGR00299 family) protein
VRLAYFDCFSGMSGEMALGAMIHAGADLQEIARTIAGLVTDEFELSREEVEVQGIAATRIHLRTGPHGVIRTYASMRTLLAQSDLPEQPRRAAQRIYRRLAEATAKVHAKDVELVTFNEFGRLGGLVEILGCALALDQLGVERVFASAVPTGLGMVRTEHGLMPVPGPVVLELLRGAPTYSRGIPVELVTPTGAALLAATSEGYGEMPMMRNDVVGYGAGEIRLDFPHIVRVVIGEAQPAAGDAAKEGTPFTGTSEVMVEATLEDADPSRHEPLLDRLLEAGARDAWMTSGIGPKGRARLTISAVAPASRAPDVVRTLRVQAGAGQVRIARTTMADPEEM